MITKRPGDVDGEVAVTFVVDATGHQGPIRVAGDFTGWDEQPVELEPLDGDRVAVTLFLRAGMSHEFRYLDGAGRWFNDDQADDYCPNAWGGVNGVVRT